MEANYVHKDSTSLVQENKELKLELSGYRQAILVDKDMLALKEENQELKQKYLNAVSDYETTMFEKEQLNSLVNSCQEEIRQLKKQLEEYKEKKQEWINLLDMFKNQQKKFIKHMNYIIKELEAEDVDDEDLKDYIIQRIGAFKEILQKYKIIIGVSDDKTN